MKATVVNLNTLQMSISYNLIGKIGCKSSQKILFLTESKSDNMSVSTVDISFDQLCHRSLCYTTRNALTYALSITGS